MNCLQEGRGLMGWSAGVAVTTEAFAQEIIAEMPLFCNGEYVPQTKEVLVDIGGRIWDALKTALQPFIGTLPCQPLQQEEIYLSPLLTCQRQMLKRAGGNVSQRAALSLVTMLPIGRVHARCYAFPSWSWHRHSPSAAASLPLQRASQSPSTSARSAGPAPLRWTRWAAPAWRSPACA